MKDRIVSTADILANGGPSVFAFVKADPYRSDVSARYIEEQSVAQAVKRSGRSGVLELAVLGLLHESPMHGYELSKRLNTMLGAFRAFSYGSLYPCLKQML